MTRHILYLLYRSSIFSSSGSLGCRSVCVCCSGVWYCVSLAFHKSRIFISSRVHIRTPDPISARLMLYIYERRIEKNVIFFDLAVRIQSFHCNLKRQYFRIKNSNYIYWFINFVHTISFFWAANYLEFVIISIYILLIVTCVVFKFYFFHFCSP